MKFRTELKSIMERVEKHLAFNYGHQRVLEMLQDENARLREENNRLIGTNNKLLDRLMARDFEQFAVYQEPEPGEYVVSNDANPEQDETNIGEVVDNATTE
jgi:hypothetical protein